MTRSVVAAPWALGQFKKRFFQGQRTFGRSCNPVFRRQPADFARAANPACHGTRSQAVVRPESPLCASLDARQQPLRVLAFTQDGHARAIFRRGHVAQLFDRAVADDPALADDYDAVGGRFDLLQNVRREDRKFPCARLLTSGPRRLVRVEAGGRFVENDDRDRESAPAPACAACTLGQLADDLPVHRPQSTLGTMSVRRATAPPNNALPTGEAASMSIYSGRFRAGTR